MTTDYGKSNTQSKVYEQELVKDVVLIERIYAAFQIQIDVHLTPKPLC